MTTNIRRPCVKGAVANATEGLLILFKAMLTNIRLLCVKGAVANATEGLLIIYRMPILPTPSGATFLCTRKARNAVYIGYILR